MVFPYFLKQIIEERARNRKGREELLQMRKQIENSANGVCYFNEILKKNVDDFIKEVDDI